MVGVVVGVAKGRASLACGGEAGGKRPGKDVGAAACRDVEGLFRFVRYKLSIG